MAEARDIAPMSEVGSTAHVQPSKANEYFTDVDDATSGSHHQHGRRRSSASSPGHGVPQLVPTASSEVPPHSAGIERGTAGGWRTKWLSFSFDYFKTRYFWYALVLGQVLALCITSTNTFSTLLANEGTNIPSFQTLFNYILLFLVYTPYTIFKYGWKRWFTLLWKDSWRYIIFAFLDVVGNYLVVRAYNYATILSLQLINFAAILVVVVVSLIFLHVRYHLTQYAGILVCIGGMGLLLASDHITSGGDSGAADQLKGDLLALAGAACYGLANTLEEFLVSKRPIYEVIGQLSLWAIIINGVICAIFDRKSFATATWNGDVAGYLVGYTLVLFIFYSLAPIMFRLSSAAFFNISLLTGNFWGVIIGIHVFHYSVHYLYPIAFVLIIVGLFIYFLSEGVFGEAKKPWLGEGQEEGVAGVGTAKRMQEQPDAIV